MQTRIARLTSVFACACVLCLALAAGAEGSITSTKITSPGDPTYFTQKDGSPAYVTVHGTVESSGSKPGEGIELRRPTLKTRRWSKKSKPKNSKKRKRRRRRSRSK